MSFRTYHATDIIGMSNRALILYAYRLPIAYANTEIGESDYTYGKINTLNAIRGRIAVDLLRWDDYPDYVPYRYGDIAWTAKPVGILKEGVKVIVGLIEYVDLDPLRNVYSIRSEPTGNVECYARECELRDLV